MRLLSIRLAALTLIAFAALGAIKKEKDRKRAPDFELMDAAGATVRLSDYKGKVVLLDFWATWCVPCKTEIPWFIEFANRYKEQDLVVLGVSMDQDGWPAVKPFIEKMGINYPIVLGTKRTAYLYGDIDSLPVTFLIDRRQRVASIHVGLAQKKELEDHIEKLLNPIPNPAR